MANEAVRGIRPKDRIQASLEWDFAGRVYRAETRWFHASGATDMSNVALPTNFEVSPAAGECLLINRVTLIVIDTAGAWDSTDFGTQTALSNGVSFTLRKDGSQVHDFTATTNGIGPIKSNQTLWCYTTPDFDYQNLDTGNTMMAATWDFVGSHAPVFLDATDDLLRFAMNDDTNTQLVHARADLFVNIEE